MRKNVKKDQPKLFLSHVISWEIRDCGYSFRFYFKVRIPNLFLITDIERECHCENVFLKDDVFGKRN